MTTEEKRKSTRVGLISAVQVQPVAPEGSSSIAWGADLSEGGIELLAINPLKVGEEVSLQISVPGSDMPISVKGRVVRAQPTHAGHRIGMQFQDVEALAQARILQLVTDRLAPLPAPPASLRKQEGGAPPAKPLRARKPWLTILLAVVALALLLQNTGLRRSLQELKTTVAALQSK